MLKQKKLKLLWIPFTSLRCVICWCYRINDQFGKFGISLFNEMKRISKKQWKVKIAIWKSPAFTLIYKTIKEKSWFKQRYSKILLMSLIKTLFRKQLSSLGINPQIKTLILLASSCKQEPMLTMQSATSVGESLNMLLVLHKIATFFTDGGIDRFIARQSTFSVSNSWI